MQVAVLADGLTRRDSFSLSSEWPGTPSPVSDWPLYADLPGTFYSLSLGAGTPPEGGFVINGRWVDRYMLTAGAAARASRVTALTP